MSIKFYNTIKRKKEIFEPIESRYVSLYTCGPTVYDYSHIGNFRTFIFEDLLKRWLIYSGYEVKHVMNITDVDDKTIKRSTNKNIPLEELTQFYESEFKKDLNWLKIIKANFYPKATQSIPKILSIISNLLEKKYAYIGDDGSVYFKIGSFKNYGKLSNIALTKLKFQKSILKDEYSKEAPRDFALWKIYKTSDGAVFWDSPWGKGRPGWHIECSAMSIENLGESIDIHCGGVDNIFPHHENEIAQSECYSGKNFVNYWIHSEHLMIGNGKMSKSEGDVFTINALKKNGFSAASIRYLLLSGHYRTRITFSLDLKIEAENVIKRIKNFAERLVEKGAQDLDLKNLKTPKELTLFKSYMDDDLNTPKAFAVFFNYIRVINKKVDNNNLSKLDLEMSWCFLNDFNSIFELINLNDKAIPSFIKSLLALRKKARQKKDWNESDRLRLEILKEGYQVRDSKNGQKITSKTN